MSIFQNKYKKSIDLETLENSKGKVGYFILPKKKSVHNIAYSLSTHPVHNFSLTRFLCSRGKLPSRPSFTTSQEPPLPHMDMGEQVYNKIGVLYLLGVQFYELDSCGLNIFQNKFPSQLSHL